jgi:2-polyprenyl-6-methoxyphenol hydroxylase-like FAD-dependent oxidoreductase
VPGPTHTQCCIVGCGPAGAMLGLLLARNGIDVVVLEKHVDFLRDFRGDDIASATMEVLDEIGLAEKFLALAVRKVRLIRAHTPGGAILLGDLATVRTPFPFVAVVPQWDFLSMLTNEASRYSAFHLRMGAEGVGLVIEDGIVRGVRYRTAEGESEVRALLTVAADGRDSTLRATAGLTVIPTAPPIDVMVFRLPRRPDEPTDPDMNIHLGDGWAMARLDRGDYWQAACVIPKGSADAIRANGLDRMRESIATVMPQLARHVGALESWNQLHLLNVRADRLRRWYRPGLLAIGDAAHAMSPIGGTGVNFAVHDAVVTANRLTRALARGVVTDRDLAGVQRERAWQVRLMQAMQGRLTKGYLAAAATDHRGPRALAQKLGPRLLNLPGFLSVRSRITALGIRRVHVVKGPSWRA